MTPKTPPQTSKDFLTRAAECERLAETATRPENREVMLYLAARWRALAAQDEVRFKSRMQETQSATSGWGYHPMKGPAALHAEIAHLRSLANLTTDPKTLAEINELIHELELRLRRSGNGAAK